MIANQDNEPQAVRVRRAGKQGQELASKAQAGVEQGEFTQKPILTRKQLAVLHVLMDPDNAGKSDLELIALAGVSNSTFYKVMRDPQVQAEHQQMCKDLIAKQVAPIIQRSIKVATSEGRDGFQDRRLLLSMSGHYVERKQQDVTVKGVLVGVVNVSMDQL